MLNIILGGPPSPILQEVVVEVFPSKTCNRQYSRLRDFWSRFPQGMNSKNTLCAGDKDGGKDACSVSI